MSKNTLLSELINYISANSSGNVVIAAPTSGFALDVTGTGRFTGALSGTSATFSGTVTSDQTDGGVIYTKTAGALVGLITSTFQILGSGSKLDLNAYVYGGESFGVWTNGSKRLTINGSGNVGIGTTSPQTILSIETSGVQSTISPVITAQSSGVTYAGMYTIRDGAGDQRGLIFQNYTANVGLTEKMRITSAGDLLLGTTSAAYTSSGRGLIEMNGSVSSLLALKISNSVGSYLFASSSNTELYSTNPLFFSVNGAERMRITSGGNVLIGTSVDGGGYKLQVGGLARLANTNTVLNYGELDANNIYFQALNAASSASKGFVWYGTGEYMRITSGGNVGIATASPGSKLQISDGSIGNASGSNNINVYGSVSSGDAAQLYLYQKWNSLVYPVGMGASIDSVYGVAAAALSFYVSVFNGTNVTTTRAMYINPTGNVGIGGTAGTGRLQIWGQDQSSSNYGLVVYDSQGNVSLSLRNDRLVAFPGINNFTTGNAPNTWINPNSSFGIYINTSSIRYKKDIVNYDKGLDIVNQLRPVYYKGISEVDGDKQFAGFIAEEVHDLGLTEFVNYLEDGRPNSLSYPNMITLLTKSIQELKQEIDLLKQQ